jgi:hypothetical protein
LADAIEGYFDRRPPECPADRTAASRLAIDLTVLIPPRSDGSENEKLTAQAGL